MRSTFGILFLGMFMVAAFLGSVRAARSDSAPAAGPTLQLNIFNYKFDPETVTIKAGTTVTWTNKDEVPHTVASTDKTFKGSAGLDTGDSYSYTFAKPGTYSYYCTLHPFMKGTIVVTAAGG